MFNKVMDRGAPYGHHHCDGYLYWIKIQAVYNKNTEAKSGVAMIAWVVQ